MNIWSKLVLAKRRGTAPTSMPSSDVIRFADGVEISVQASQFHYCAPKINTPPAGGWTAFEVWGVEGLTDAEVALLYGMSPAGARAASESDPAACVSVEALDRVAEAHGGFADD